MDVIGTNDAEDQIVPVDRAPQRLRTVERDGKPTRISRYRKGDRPQFSNEGVGSPRMVTGDLVADAFEVGFAGS